MHSLLKDNIGCLEQGIRLLGRLDAPAYRHLSPQCFESTVGGHIRHNVDHYLSFLRGFATGEVDYDKRDRDTQVEEDPVCACDVMRTIVEGLESISVGDLDRPLDVKMDCGTVDESEAWSRSTVRRELQFLLSHTIHHYALIAVICTLQGIRPEPEFGVAPSTLRHKESNLAPG